MTEFNRLEMAFLEGLRAGVLIRRAGGSVTLPPRQAAPAKAKAALSPPDAVGVLHNFLAEVIDGRPLRDHLDRLWEGDPEIVQLLGEYGIAQHGDGIAVSRDCALLLGDNVERSTCPHRLVRQLDGARKSEKITFPAGRARATVLARNTLLQHR